MSIKLRETATLELPTDEVCRLLTEALCDFISPFANMEVYRLTRTKHGKLRLDMMSKARLHPPKPAMVKRDAAA